MEDQFSQPFSSGGLAPGRLSDARVSDSAACTRQAFAALRDFKHEVGYDLSQAIIFKLQLGNEKHLGGNILRQRCASLPAMQRHDADAQPPADGSLAAPGSQKLGCKRQFFCNLAIAVALRHRFPNPVEPRSATAVSLHRPYGTGHAGFSRDVDMPRREA